MRQFVRFGISGLVGLAADMGVLYLAMALGSGYYFGRLLSFLSAVWVTWRLNRRFTFQATPSAWREWWRYLTVTMGGGVINLGAYMGLLQVLPETDWAPAIGVAAGSLAGMAFNFISAKYFVFRKS
ncbi:GtrA family protein [Pseudoduganella eburnea]|uniref:GtrA family protein n=1 Tax=Massilia eburnea TaxID=1776165 RepID=A0A6L6QMR3_9BURK|nr:GtrA family protein [Massilia eburnea]MTW12986.1 GtrA family protein [Massilia eburnea]